MLETSSELPLVTLHSTSRDYQGCGVVERLIEHNTISKVLTRLQLNEPSMPALTWYEGDIQVQTYSYRELLRRVHDLAHWFMFEHGVNSGNTVVVVSSNCPEAYIAHLAIMSIGAVTVPVSNTESQSILQVIINKVQPCLLVTGRDVDPKHRLAHGVPVCPLPSLGELPSAEKKQLLWPSSDVLPDDPAVILFTSGTTSEPKGVCLSHYNLLVNSEGLTRTHNLRENKVHMCILPLFHANAFGLSMVTSIYTGNHTVLCSGLPGIEIWSVIREQRVNTISLVPEIIRVLASVPAPKFKMPDLKYVMSAAAPLPKMVAHEFMNRTGIDIHQGYGLSECVNFAASIPWNIDETELRQALMDWEVPSIGPQVFGCNIDILDNEGLPVTEGEQGEIVISGHTVMLGYWGEVEETQKALGEGYLRTGDLGFFSMIGDSRYYFVTGRKKEVIIRYGENISPLTIESQLNSLNIYGRFAITGFVNENAGEEIGLYIHRNHTSDIEDKIIELVMECTSRYRPRVVIFGNKPIPATPTGKVKRRLLSEWFYPYEKHMFGNNTIVGIP